jgi:uncharacterized protein involved in exopolysaccharide biosynthesis
MENTSLTIPSSTSPFPAPRVKEVVAMGFRWRTRMIIAFWVSLIGALLASYFLSRDYQSNMKILVNRERVDPLVAPDQNSPPLARREVTEEELNSELELMTSEAVLHQVVIETGLQKRTAPPLWFRLFGPMTGATEEEVRTAKAVRLLTSHLTIKAPKKSNVIEISYHSDDPQLSARVLTAYAKAYLEKHTAVHRPPGQFDFFEIHADQYHRELLDAENRLAEFSRNGGTVSGEREKDVAIEKLGELRSTLQETQAAINEAQKRVTSLQQQMSSTAPRITTSLRLSENPELMMQIKSKLLELELKRTELLQKFEPTYPLVREVEQAIAKTRATIAAEQAKPMRDETTDRDLTYEWMRAELAKARTDRDSLQSKAAVIGQSIFESEQRIRQLGETSLKQDDLQREVKTLEANYLLYSKKREEARISDAMDRSRILNVTVAEPPNIPALPRHSPMLLALAGVMMATMISVGTAVVSEWTDNSFRTPDEVVRYLDVPVLAALRHAEKAPRTLEVRS